MAITAELHDGTRLEFPDGTDPAVIQRTVKSVLAKQAPAAVEAGQSLREIPRQIGLAARHGLEGLGQVADIGAEPIRQLVVNPIMRMVGGPQAAPVSQGARSLADTIGLPSPQNANERVIGDASRLVAGAGATAGLAGRAAAQALPGVAKQALGAMAARPGIQAAGATTAGLAGGSVREAGGGQWEQFAASLLGGVAGGLGASAAVSAGSRGVQAAKAALTPKAVQLQAADQKITMVLERAGIDWAAVPERIKQGMRGEVAAALNTGQPLNADALRRLLVFQQAGVKPTIGQLTQDPGLITREMNLAKTGANSMDASLQGLSQQQNTNVATLLRQLDDAGAAKATDALGAGRAGVGSLLGREAAAKSNINALYERARDSQGRSLPLNHGVFNQRVSQLLDEANVGSFLPADIRNKINAMASGKPGYGLTVESAEQLKTSIGNLQRGSSDGNARTALKLVRQALDETPLFDEMKGANPGNLPAIPGTVPPSTAAGGEAAMNAFKEARAANRQWMQRVESNPALKAAIDGADPDQFVQKFIVGNGAAAGDVKRLAQEMGPAASGQIKGYLVRYLKDAATNSTDDITKFSNDAYRRALRGIGDEKLAAFFSKEELAHLKNLGEAAKYMQAQPTGSAVNNSNSGALMMGRGMDMLGTLAAKAPLGLDRMITGTIQGVQQRQVMSPRNALALMQPKPGVQPINPMLASMLAVPAKEDRK